MKPPRYFAIPLSGLLSMSSMTVIAEEREKALIYHSDAMVVTAQKTEQNVQDVGIAITTFSDRDIDELNLWRPTDISNLLPNTQVVKSALPVFSIRGVGLSEFAPNLDGPVAIHIDEVYQSKAFQATNSLYDMERVEVLRGPQGTLFGRNTSGGSVNYTTKKPTFDYEAGGKVSYSRYDRKEVEGFVSGPLSELLLGRLSGLTKQSSDGPTHNLVTGDNIGSQDEINARGQLLWFPNDETEILLSTHIGQDNSVLQTYSIRGTYDASVHPGVLRPCPNYSSNRFSEKTPGCVLPTGGEGADNNPHTVITNRGNQLDNESFGTSVNIKRDFEQATFTSITAYEFYERDLNEDFDGSTDKAFEIDWFSHLNEFTQEFRLSGKDKDDKSWVIGAFIEHDDFDANNFLTTEDHPLAGFNGINLATEYSQATDSIALFGHKETSLHEQWTLITGLRYTWERVKFDGKTQAQLASSPTVGEENRLSAPILTLAEINDQQMTQDLSFKLGLNYQPKATRLYYSSVSTGFKTGGFNGGFAFSNEEFSEYQPEEILAYEVGAKFSFPEQRLQVNTAAFYYDLSKPQLNADAPTPPNFITTNADSSTHKGIEIETIWQPIEGLDIRTNLGWLSAEYGEFYIFGVNQAGNKVVNSPEWTFNGLVRYETPITQDFKLITLTDYSYRSSRYLSSSNVHTSYEEGYWLVNSRLALASNNDKFEIGIWVRNIFDQAYRNYMNDVSGLGIVGDLWNEPRTYGVDVSYVF